MKKLHAHEVLHMMEGKSFTEESLIQEIQKQFGSDTLFYTCSADDMDAASLVNFLKEKGKFMDTETGFTVDISKKCNHG